MHHCQRAGIILRIDLANLNIDLFDVSFCTNVRYGWGAVPIVLFYRRGTDHFNSTRHGNSWVPNLMSDFHGNRFPKTQSHGLFTVIALWDFECSLCGCPLFCGLHSHSSTHRVLQTRKTEQNIVKIGKYGRRKPNKRKTRTKQCPNIKFLYRAFARSSPTIITKPWGGRRAGPTRIFELTPVRTYSGTQ